MKGYLLVYLEAYKKLIVTKIQIITLDVKYNLEYDLLFLEEDL